MELRFDQGTIVLTEPPGDADPGQAPGVHWDPRVHAHRAPASSHAALRRWLLERGVRFRDLAPRPRLAPEAWSDIDLRPYQEAALTAREIARRRGVVALPTGSGKARVALRVRD